MVHDADLVNVKFNLFASVRDKAAAVVVGKDGVFGYHLESTKLAPTQGLESPHDVECTSCAAASRTCGPSVASLLEGVFLVNCCKDHSIGRCEGHAGGRLAFTTGKPAPDAPMREVLLVATDNAMPHVQAVFDVTPEQINVVSTNISFEITTSNHL